jgi:hypothetical protein
MLIGLGIILFLIILAIFLICKGVNPTLTLLAKIFVYFTLTVLFIGLIFYILNSSPPIPNESKGFL